MDRKDLPLPKLGEKVCLQNVFRLISIDVFCSQYQYSSIFNFTFTIMKKKSHAVKLPCSD